MDFKSIVLDHSTTLSNQIPMPKFRFYYSIDFMHHFFSLSLLVAIFCGTSPDAPHSVPDVILFLFRDIYEALKTYEITVYVKHIVAGIWTGLQEASIWVFCRDHLGQLSECGFRTTRNSNTADEARFLLWPSCYWQTYSDSYCAYDPYSKIFCHCKWLYSRRSREGLWSIRTNRGYRYQLFEKPPSGKSWNRTMEPRPSSFG